MIIPIPPLARPAPPQTHIHPIIYKETTSKRFLMICNTTLTNLHFKKISLLLDQSFLYELLLYIYIIK
jgi:hypothetical protein